MVFSNSCKTGGQPELKSSVKSAYSGIIKESYELHKPSATSNAVLVLFGGFPETAAAIEREFEILKIAEDSQVAVLFMNYNQKLFLRKSEKEQLTKELEAIFDEHKLERDNVFIGGFSSGGNMTLLLSNHLIAVESKVQPKGVFIVDSPVDLLALYKVAEKNRKRNFSEISTKESDWLIALMQEEFGNPENGISAYEEYSPFTAQSGNIQNLSSLDGVKIRLYTEPDTVWWKENRQNEADELNAYYIEKLANQLKGELSNSHVEFIPTENKGYRASGERHPHSWSIVDKAELMEWMIGENE